VFLIAALYDGALGAIFLIAPGLVFHGPTSRPPNHWAYVQFPAALLIIFGLMFAAIAKDPIATATSSFYGILLKVSYCGIASWYLVHGRNSGLGSRSRHRSGDGLLFVCLIGRWAIGSTGRRFKTG